MTRRLMICSLIMILATTIHYSDIIQVPHENIFHIEYHEVPVVISNENVVETINWADRAIDVPDNMTSIRFRFNWTIVGWMFPNFSKGDTYRYDLNIEPKDDWNGTCTPNTTVKDRNDPVTKYGSMNITCDLNTMPETKRVQGENGGKLPDLNETRDYGMGKWHVHIRCGPHCFFCCAIPIMSWNLTVDGTRIGRTITEIF